MGHKNLEVYNLGLDLVEEVYKLTKKLPEEEKYGLIGQIRRAAVSIPANIAEGATRNSKKDFNHFLNIAIGSAVELETLIEICKRLKYVTDDNTDKIEKILKTELSKLHGLKKTLLKRIN